MMFTYGERRLLLLYYAGTISDTANTVCDALAYITDRDEYEAAMSILFKLSRMSAAEFYNIEPEGLLYG